MKESLHDILDKSLDGNRLTDEELVFLLEQKSAEEQSAVFEAARKMRNRFFGNKVFLYGFVYFSTYCRNNCTFCYFRKASDKPERYRKTEDEILETAQQLKQSGIHLIDLTMGEDGYFTDENRRLVHLVKRIKEEVGLPVMVSPGVVSADITEELARAGADWYALYQETHSRPLFRKIRIGQSYDERMEAKKEAARQGMLLEEGLMTGIGDTTRDIVYSMRVMEKLRISQGRTMTFVPQEGTPLEHQKTGSHRQELLNIAVMRLLFGDILIPASLDVDGIRGLEERLMAGANVVTSLIPPRKGFAGVANPTCDIDDGFRTVDGIRDILMKCGLTAASVPEYQFWIDRRKKTVREKGSDGICQG
ncbi:MAG: methylornithine synthase PylB [Ruminococcus sp.]|jgi:methylornithine synthase